ncbi:tryptophan synthase subunit alpha [bacterium]|nr:tryptophan synthase subunit alpha [bacterium]
MTISDVFNSRRTTNEPALILYYPAGFPDMDTSMQHIVTLAENGADIIEIGIPFSDPLADGPVIQHASAAALAAGATLRAVLERIADLALDTPLVLMSYLNPLESLGSSALARTAAVAGFSGVIIPDLPLEHAEHWLRVLNGHGIGMIFLAAPNTAADRLKAICARSRGFIYAVGRYGTTGSGGRPTDNSPMVSAIKKLTDTPVALGFGISSPADVQSAGRLADGVIVGSRLVEAVSRGEDLAALVRSLKNAAAGARRDS